jgi:hypothetical protein
MIRAIGAAVASVVDWTPVSFGWQEHRPEPLVAQRLWACRVPGFTDLERRRGWARLAGRDAQGNVVVVGPLEYPADTWGSTPWHRVDLVERPAGRVIVHGLGRHEECRVTTILDAQGRASRTEYAGPFADEHYIYDADDRVVGIDESAGIASLGPDSLRTAPIGGALIAAYAPTGHLATVATATGEIVWRRDPRPWSEAVAAFGTMIGSQCRDVAYAELAAAGVSVDERVFSLQLVCPPDPDDLQPYIVIGFDADRQRWISDVSDSFALEERLWFCNELPGEPHMLAGPRIEPEALTAMTRLAAANSPATTANPSCKPPLTISPAPTGKARSHPRPTSSPTSPARTKAPPASTHR